MSTAGSPHVDLLLLSLGGSQGAKHADHSFAELAREAGASVEVVGTRVGAADRLALGYLGSAIVEALAARRALTAALNRCAPRAVVFSSSTAALLAEDWSMPFTVWLDAPLALSHPGWPNRPLHVWERRRLAKARFVLARSEEAAAALPSGSAPAIVFPPPVELPSPRTMSSDPVVVAYAADPAAGGLELICRAWQHVRTPRARLIVTGISESAARGYLMRHRIREPPAQLELRGWLPQDEFSALLAQARVFLTASAWESFGTVALEALAHGAVLAGAPAEGPFPALAIARQLAPRFIAPDRSPAAVALALDEALKASAPELAGYQNAVRDHLRPYRERILVKRLREEVLPALLG